MMMTMNEKNDPPTGLTRLQRATRRFASAEQAFQAFSPESVAGRARPGFEDARKEIRAARAELHAARKAEERRRWSPDAEGSR